MRLIGSMLPLLVLAATLRAEPLDRRQVPADAKWLIHVDADAARDAKVGQTMLEAIRALPQAQAALAKAQACFGMDLTTDLSSFTAYGKDFVPDAGVLIVRGKLNRDKLLQLVHAAPQFKTVTVRGHEVWTWSEGNQQNAANADHSAAAFVDERTVLLAHDVSAIRDGLDVLDGVVNPLKGTDSLLAQPPPEGTVLQAGATGLANLQLPDHSPVVRQCESGQVAMGEHAGLAFLHGQITAGSQEVASQLQQLLRGIQAAAQLNAMKNADQFRLLAPLKITAEGQTVHVDWEFSSEEVSSIIAAQLKEQLGVDHAQPGKGH